MVALIASAFLSLTATFTFVSFFFSFAFGEENVAATGGGFRRHVPILVQEILLKRGKVSSLVESGVGAPTGDVGVKLRPALDRGKDIVDGGN